MPTIIQPISPTEFTSTLVTGQGNGTIDYEAYFMPLIGQAINFAIGPYCWFIPDNTVMKIVAASANMDKLTPYTQQEWVGKDPFFLASNIHPDDSFYVLSAIAKGAEITEGLPMEKRKEVRPNIYGRMLDASRNYRWTLIQFPAHYFNAAGRIESTCLMMTDVSHLQMGKGIQKPMMTVIDETNSNNQYFRLATDTKTMLPLNLPNITKRERELMQLIAKGLTTPEIVAALNISYNTVENHKRNLRQKTKTKTSAELMHYVLVNNLL